MYSIQHYVIKFVRDLWQAGRWFSLGTPISSINETDRHDITEILLKVALNTITLTAYQNIYAVVPFKGFEKNTLKTTVNVLWDSMHN